ncbi:hypothetical protein GQX74_000611 [Glossina fuscipes]|nr:hypothetical protein GQX74_000611 [Glossina fuscipes]
MIMHGTTTWYKGPQLAHHTHHADYHHHHHTQLRSYPSFVLSGSYHDNSSLNVSTGGAGCLTPNGPSATPILVESSYAGINQLSATNIGASQLTILSPTIKVEQNFAEPLSSVEDYALNLESSGGNNNIEGTFKLIFLNCVNSVKQNSDNCLSDQLFQNFRGTPRKSCLLSNLVLICPILFSSCSTLSPYPRS